MDGTPPLPWIWHPGGGCFAKDGWLLSSGHFFSAPNLSSPFFNFYLYYYFLFLLCFLAPLPYWLPFYPTPGGGFLPQFALILMVFLFLYVIELHLPVSRSMRRMWRFHQGICQTFDRCGWDSPQVFVCWLLGWSYMPEHFYFPRFSFWYHSREGCFTCHCQYTWNYCEVFFSRFATCGWCHHCEGGRGFADVL